MDEPILPVEPTEPKPWTVEVWRYKVSSREVFATRESAIEFARDMGEGDSCYIEGVFNPDGVLDKVATREAFPWRRDLDEPKRYGPGRD